MNDKDTIYLKVDKDIIIDTIQDGKIKKRKRVKSYSGLKFWFDEEIGGDVLDKHHF